MPDKEQQIWDSLASKEYREAIAIEDVNISLALQIRRMRKKLEWSQAYLASYLGKSQSMISHWENPDYGQHGIKALRELAATFDVALAIRFIPFSELVKDILNLSERKLCPPSFTEERDNKI